MRRRKCHQLSDCEAERVEWEELEKQRKTHITACEQMILNEISCFCENRIVNSSGFIISVCAEDSNRYGE